MMPVWPVARKVAYMPSSRIARCSASAVYFLPTAQSVPTINSRLPLRFLPLAAGMPAGGRRMSISRRPVRAAAAASSGTAANGMCMPLTMSNPASSASTSVAVHCGCRAPPTGATPMIRLRAPAAAASAGVISGSPRSATQPGKRNCARQCSRRQSTRPCPVLASSWPPALPRKISQGDGNSIGFKGSPCE